MKNKKYILVATLGATLLISSCGGEDKKAVTDNYPAVAVQIKTASDDGSSPYLTVSGKVEAAKSANISTRTMGYVDKVYVQVGDKVRKGELLLSVNNADISAKLAQVNASITEATAAFTNAEKDYNRFTALFQENSASQKELDDITAQYKMTKARLESANQMKNGVNAQMGYANIRAPFNGVVTNKFINAGDMANPGMSLLEVESPSTYQVSAMVPESEILQIKNNAEVTVQLNALNQTIKGKVVEVSTSSKSTGGQYLVKANLDKTDVNIMSGMYATVQFPVERNNTSSAIMIPIEAIVKNGQLSGIYTVSQSNTALLRWLRLGRIVGDRVEVLSGLSADEHYIISSEGKLFNGARILNQ